VLNKDPLPDFEHSEHKKHGGRMSDTTQALAMLTALASVGVHSFDMTITDIEGEKVEGKYRGNLSLNELRRTIGRTLQECERERHNLIIRPRSTRAVLIQLDDLAAEKAESMEPHAFMVIRTSPGNYQAWVAVEGIPPEKEGAKDFARRLRKGAGADPTASGSTRASGSWNFKTKYAPAFPLVEITHTNPGNIATTKALDRAGFVAAQAQPRPTPPAVNRVSATEMPNRKKWPSYAFCIKHAPLTHGEDRPDTSRADFTWCRTAIEWGWGIQDTAARLMELSSKAQQNGAGYAAQTATRAAESVERQPYRLKTTPRPA
jgi:hypothetical protein